MDLSLYDYRPITDRPTIAWPGGARVALYVGLNVEHFHADAPSTALVEATSTLVPDPLNQGWREYGSRVGIWRVIDILDRHGVRASALLNAEVCERFPQIIAAGRERGWAWLAHGATNSRLHTGLEPDEERAVLRQIVQTIEDATGHRPRGWLGPALTETLQTPALLAELGLDHVLDWTNDDQPYALTVPGMWSVPYSVELNDLGVFTMHGQTGPEFLQLFTDHLDQLVEDAADSGRVAALALHPFVIGQPARARYLDRALAYAAAHPAVWLATTEELLDHYVATTAGGRWPGP